VAAKDCTKEGQIEHVSLQKLGNSDEVFGPADPQATRHKMFRAENPRSHGPGIVIDVRFFSFSKGRCVEVISHGDKLNGPPFDHNILAKLLVALVLPVRKYWLQCN